MCGSHAGFPYKPFLTFAVADHCIHVAGIPGMLCPDRHADGNGDALSKRTRGGIHARAFLDIRMSLQNAAQLAESVKFFPSEITSFAKRSVQGGSSMSLGQNKAVSGGILVVRGIYTAHHFKIQCNKKIRAGKRSAGMTGSCF